MRRGRVFGHENFKIVIINPSAATNAVAVINVPKGDGLESSCPKSDGMLSHVERSGTFSMADPSAGAIRLAETYNELASPSDAGNIIRNVFHALLITTVIRSITEWPVSGGVERPSVDDLPQILINNHYFLTHSLGYL